MEYELHDSEFLTAKEKALTIKQWKRFITNGLQFGDFTDRLYKHLSLHCEFIAHFGRAGFYQTYFENPEDTLRFLRQFDEDYGFVSVEYRMTQWITDARYADLNGAMCDILSPYKTKLYAELSEKARQKDIAIARALLEKHGLTNGCGRGRVGRCG